MYIPKRFITLAVAHGSDNIVSCTNLGFSIKHITIYFCGLYSIRMGLFLVVTNNDYH